MRSGGVTCAYGAGNCQDQAAVTYTILRSKLTRAETVSLCVNQTLNHHFATIGNPNTDPANEVIAVDPWPLNAQALLLEDHFWQRFLEVVNNPITGVPYTKTGGKRDYMTRLQKHAPMNASNVREHANADTWNVDEINAGKEMWTELYCSRNQITWVYKVRAT